MKLVEHYGLHVTLRQKLLRKIIELSVTIDVYNPFWSTVVHLSARIEMAKSDENTTNSFRANEHSSP